MNKKLKYIIIICMLLLTNTLAISTTSLSINNDQADDKKNKVITEVNAKGDCAVFITGGGQGTDLLAEAANTGADFFKTKGYNTKVVTYYDDIFPLLSARDAIINWIPDNLADNSQIFIYIGAHSDVLSTLVIGYIARIPQISLKLWIDNMESKCNPSVVTIVIESCQSGRFISKLKGPDRIVITSTDTIHFAYYNPIDEFVYFSTPFFEGLQMGKSYGSAWEHADKNVDCMETRKNTSIELQDPKIDDYYNNGVGSTVGSSFVDKIRPANRFALRVYPTHIQTSKSIKPHSNLLKISEKFPALQLLFENIFKLKNEVD